MGLLKNLFNGLGKSSFSKNNISDISDGIENNPSSKNVILSYGGGFTDSVMGFQSWGLNNSQFGKHINKLHSVKDIKSFNLENIRTRFYKDNRSVTQFENPLDTNIYTPYKSYYGNSSVNNTVSNVENIFNPDVNSLLLMNNYKFQYKEPIKVKIDEYADKDGNKKAKYVPIKVVPALFNPLYMVQSIGMARNTPLLNLRNYEGYGDGTTYSNNVDTSDCTIRTLVKLSRLDYGELGTARFAATPGKYYRSVEDELTHEVSWFEVLRLTPSEILINNVAEEDAGIIAELESATDVTFSYVQYSYSTTSVKEVRAIGSVEIDGNNLNIVQVLHGFF